MSNTSQKELDLLVGCSDCRAAKGEPCSIDPLVHFNRRIDRLLLERGATREELQKAVNEGTTLKGNSS
jgi:hypothetical protein